MKKMICAMLLALILLCAAGHAEYAFEDGHRILAGKDGRFGLENERGQVVLEPVYDEIGPFAVWPDGEKRCWLIQDGKYGWYPAADGGAVACTFDWQPEPFSAYVIYDERIFSLDGSPANEDLYARLTVLDKNHLAAWAFTGTEAQWQEMGSGWGMRGEYADSQAVILDENLKQLYTLQCDYIDPAGDGLLCAFVDFDVDPSGEKWDAGYIDLSTGAELCRKRTDLDLGEFHFGYARVFRNGPGGANLIDGSFEKVLPRDYTWITDFTAGAHGAYAILCDEIWDDANVSGHRCTLVNEKLETLMTFDVGWDTNGLWCNGEIIVNDGDYGLYYVHDMNARLLLKGKYVGPLTDDGLVRYQNEAGLWGYISHKGENVIPAQYAQALDFSNGYAAVQGGDKKWMFIDVFGRNFFESAWDYVESFRDGYAYVRNGDDGWMINTLGERVRPKLMELFSLSDSYNPYVPVSDWSGEIAQVYAEHHGMRIFATADEKYGVMDRDGKILAPGVYDKIDPPADFGGGVYRAVLQRNGRTGWVGDDGFCDAKWAVCSDQMFAGLTIVSMEGGDSFYDERGSYYLADADGSLADGVEYAEADILRNGMLALREAGSDITFVVDEAFREVFSLECSRIRFAGQDLFAYEQGGLWGLCDAKGKALTPPEFAMSFTFSDGYAAVTRYTDRDGEQQGLMNLQGEMAIPFGKYEAVYGFRDGYCIIRAEDHSYPEEDEHGTFIRPWHDYIIVDTHLNTCAAFTGNSHAISKNGRFIYFDLDESVMIDAAGNEIFRAESIGEFRNGYCRYRENGLYGFLDESGNVAIPARYADAGDFGDNGLAAVQDADGWKYINPRGEVAFAVCSQSNPGAFSDGLASLDYEWYINERGEIVAPLVVEWW